MANQDIYYVDVTKIGKDFVGKRDISLLTNEQAVVESVYNIIATEPGERVMNPIFGCGLSQYLFSPIDIITTLDIKRNIELAIETWEPRVDTLLVDVQPLEELNTYQIDVIFSTTILGQQQKLSFQLNKIR